MNLHVGNFLYTGTQICSGQKTTVYSFKISCFATFQPMFPKLQNHLLIIWSKSQSSPLPCPAVLAVRTPTISWITKEQVVDIGASVQLDCSVQYSIDFLVLWLKKATADTQDLPISNGPSIIPRELRFSLRHDTGSSTYILRVRMRIQ